MQTVQASVEKINNVERRLTVIVPADQVEEAYGKQINRFAKSAKLDGFRPGKVPVSYVHQRFGADAREEAVSEVIRKTLYEVISEQNLKPVSTPRVERKVATPNQPLEYEASFEVLPEIGEIKCTISNLEKLIVDITPEDMARVVEQLKKQYTKWKIVDRAAKEKDRVVIDYYAIFEEKSDIDNKINDFTLELGSKMMLPGFEEGLIGAKAGEERTLKLNFPTDFAIKEKEGKPVDFVIQIKQIFEGEAPTLDEDFVHKLGVKSGKEEDLREQIRQSLEQERNRLVKEKLKEQVFHQLLEQNPVDIPQSLVVKEAKNIHDEMYPEHHDHHNHSNEELTAFNDIARKRVALGLLVSEYAKQNHLKADSARVHERIQEIAAIYESPQEVVEWLSSEERLSGIESQVIEDQVLDKLIEGVPVTEKTMAYAELKGIRI